MSDVLQESSEIKIFYLVTSEKEDLGKTINGMLKREGALKKFFIPQSNSLALGIAWLAARINKKYS